MNKSNLSKVLVGAAVAILILITGISYNRYFAVGDGTSQISSELKESGELVVDMVNTLQGRLQQSLSGLLETETAKDFRSSVEIVSGSLKVIDELEQKNNALKLQTEEFKSAVDGLKDDEVRKSAEETADVLSRLILSFGEIIELERELLNMAKDYYEDLIENEDIEAPSFIQINAKVAASSSNLSSLIRDFAVKANELNNLLGVNNDINKTDGDSTELKIEDVALGQGEETKNGDTLVVHYEGFLEDGTKFDSSVDRGQAFSFVLGDGQVIQGWEQGMLGMKIGGHRRLTIPPEFGYGSQGQGAIPPNSTLIFEIDLLDIK